MKYAQKLVAGLSLTLVLAPGLEGGQGKGSGYRTRAARKASPAPTAAVVPAAEQNLLLADSLEWQFGSRPQRGWKLYTPLISRLLGSTAEPGSDEFARAVRQWRRSNGLVPADGVLDHDAWMKMVASLQAGRTRDTTPPPESEIEEVPAAEWLYPERPAELRFLRKDAYRAYKRMVAAARADLGDVLPPRFLLLVSGYRTREYQEQIRAREGNPSTAQLARNSPHFSGRAIDLYVGGDPVSTADPNRAIQVATPAYRWLVQNAHRYGFRPYFYEPWHWEYDPRLDSSR